MNKLQLAPALKEYFKTNYSPVTRTQFSAKTHGELSVIKPDQAILHSFAVTNSDNTYTFPLLSFVFHKFISKPVHVLDPIESSQICKIYY